MTSRSKYWYFTKMRISGDRKIKYFVRRPSTQKSEKQNEWAGLASSLRFSISPLKNAQTRRNKFFYFKLKHICQISLEISRIKIIPYMVMLRIMWAIGTYDYMFKIQKSVLSATQYPQACQWSAVKSIS